MAEQVSMDDVVRRVMDNIVDIIEEQERLNQVKQILNMCLSGFQFFTEETALSNEIDMSVEYLNAYLLQMKLDGCTDGSINNYKCNLKNMMAHINKNVKEITYQDLKGYLAYGKLVRKWKDRTYNSKLISIRSFFSFLYTEDLLPNNPALFVSPHRPQSRIGDQTVRNILNQIKERDADLEGVRITPHVFRRTVGTDMINKGAPIEMVKEVLGHEKVDTTLKCYAKISKETVRQAHARYVG